MARGSALEEAKGLAQEERAAMEKGWRWRRARRRWAGRRWAGRRWAGRRQARRCSLQERHRDVSVAQVAHRRRREGNNAVRAATATRVTSRVPAAASGETAGRAAAAAAEAAAAHAAVVESSARARRIDLTGGGIDARTDQAAAAQPAPNEFKPAVAGRPLVPKYCGVPERLLPERRQRRTRKRRREVGRRPHGAASHK